MNQLRDVKDVAAIMNARDCLERAEALLKKVGEVFEQYPKEPWEECKKKEIALNEKGKEHWDKVYPRWKIWCRRPSYCHGKDLGEARISWNIRKTSLNKWQEKDLRTQQELLKCLIERAQCALNLGAEVCLSEAQLKALNTDPQHLATGVQCL